MQVERNHKLHNDVCNVVVSPKDAPVICKPEAERMREREREIERVAHRKRKQKRKRDSERKSGVERGREG